MEEQRRGDLTFALGGLGALLAAFAIIYLLRAVTIPLLIALFLAYLMNPLVDHLVRMRIGRGLGISILGVGAVGAIAGLVILIIPLIQKEIKELADRLPLYARVVSDQVIPWAERITGFSIPSSFKEVLSRRIPVISPALLAPLRAFLTYVFSSLYNLFLFGLNTVLIPIYTYYILRDYEKMRSALLSYIPPAQQGRVVGRLNEVAYVLNNFLKGQLLIGLIMAVLYSLGLSLVGLEFAIAIGVISGLLNIVPYLGLILGLGVALASSLIQFRDFYHPLGVAAVYIAVQAIEGYWLTPKIMGKRVGLHPVTIIVAVLVGGELLGFLGVLLAVPVTAVLSVFIKALLASYRATSLFPQG